MLLKCKQIGQTLVILSKRWFFRWVASGVVGVSYFFSLLSTKDPTLSGVLLLTGTYGAWLGIFLTKKWFDERNHPRWLLALFCLACIAPFIPTPHTNMYWRLLLPAMTTTLLVTIKPRSLSLLLACIIWLSSSLVYSLITRHWDGGSQVIILLSFSANYGLAAAIHELALTQRAREEANERLALAHASLLEYSAQVEELSVMRERNRIAREIHDTLGHNLALLSIQLETATRFEARNDPRLHEKLLQARQVLRACLTDVRHSVEALRPAEASQGSLQEQLCKLVGAFETTCHELKITLDLEEATHPLNPEVGLTLYRCAQEALTNIYKHAHATKVLLRLSTSNQQEAQVELLVLDNGQGCEPLPEQQASGFGLRGMRERVTLLGGRLAAGPQPGHGWRVEVVLPLKPCEQMEGSATGTRASKEQVETC